MNFGTKPNQTKPKKEHFKKKVARTDMVKQWGKQ